MPWPVRDLREVVELGLERGAALCTAEERAIAEAILRLDGAPALLLARLTTRRFAPHRLPDLTAAGVEDVAAAVEVLLAAGVVCSEVSDAAKLEVATRAVLAAGCRRAGLPVSGRRDALQERLRDVSDWDDADWVNVVCWPLVTRWTRWATLEAFPDRSAAVLERMGVRTWVDYPLTSGAVLPGRERWLAWEALVDGWESLSVDEALSALSWPDWPPGGLDLRSLLVRWVKDHARELERAGELVEAERCLDALLATGLVRPGQVCVRRARVVELSGREADALEVLRDGMDTARAAEAVGIERAGRRVARQLRGSWAPSPPLRPPVERTLGLAPASTDERRPLWGADELIEDAVATVVRASGREVLHAEGPLFRTLAALLLGDVFFQPVPEQLPVARLSGPLDAWTPAFAARRAEGIWAVWDAVLAGDGPAMVAKRYARWEGRRVAGVRWDRGTGEQLAMLAEGLGPHGLCALLAPLLAWGRRESKGLPDLVVLPGPPTRVEGAWPSKLPGDLVLLEVKGPTDSVRNAQQVWFDRWIRAGVRVEVWRVEPLLLR